MKKFLKILGVVFVFILLLAAGLSLFLKSYLKEERLRAWVSEAAQKSINRDVAIGGLDISLFRGIVVRDFEIKEKDSKSAFLSTKRFVCKYQWLPLLHKKLVIDELGLEDADIFLKANPDGTFNVSDLLKKDASKAQGEEADKKAGLPVALNVENIKIKNVKIHYADEAGKLKKANVALDAEMKVAGRSSDALSSEGWIHAAIAEIALKDKTLKNVETTARYRMDADMAAKQIIVRQLDLDVMKIPVQIAGKIDYHSGAAYSLSLKIPLYNLSQLPPEAAAFLPQGMVLGGGISALLHMDKKPVQGAPVDFDGSITLQKVSCSYQKMKLILDGAAKLSPEIISLEGMKLIAGQNEARISGSVKNYREYPDVSLAVQSGLISLDDLLGTAPASERPPKSAETHPVKKEPEPKNLKLKADVSLDIAKTVYRGIAIHDFSSRYELKNNVFSVPYLKGKTLSGAFFIKGAVDLAQRGTAYNVSADFNGVKLEDIVSAFAPKAKDKLFGTLSGKAVFSGSGTVWENLKRNLKGSGTFAVHDGTIRNTEIGEELLALLGLRDLKEIKMDTANGDFTIADGNVNLKTVIRSKDMTLDEAGAIGLDQRLNLSVLVKVSDRLAPKLVSQSSIAQFLSNEKGWTSLPLRVGGTLSQPSFGVDMKYVGKKVTEELQKKVGEEFQKILLKDKSKATSGEKEQKKTTTPVERMLDIFGK
jgi:AsmA protein